MAKTTIPRPLIAAASEVISGYYTKDWIKTTLTGLNPIILLSDESKLKICRKWFELSNRMPEIDNLRNLEFILEEFMEREFQSPQDQYDAEKIENVTNQREYIKNALARHGLAYFPGGYIRHSGFSSPTRSFEQILKAKDLPAVDQEFVRALDTIESDPPSSLTAACATIEALCKAYIAEKSLELPKDQSVKPLWNIVRRDLGFDPSRVEDDDVKKILSGLSSIVDGLGALRTHAGSAHGRDKKAYKVQPRHAKLAVHAAHTLATFVIETYERQISVDKNRK